ncbi:DUF6687 family protein [Adhaeribacter pallidiroseus]|uniref:Uncharacterized protein n=1 Tax=Adhaeribacter pallidiroseus TaxID=2072847 RepID=A0A369QQR9_9BACT|nr:DUF6687 family protein [Adhaeribacter pallidiroseus]RDC65189.1 hypothetical protein AHMF7616_03819 [Adhaeribacter pallidiroseus]
MLKQFIPFTQVKQHPAIIVDSLYPKGLVLAHWRGAVNPAGTADDTSAGIVLNALEQQIPGLDVPYVSANHFDVDGFVGVWSVLNPELALQNKAVLQQMAIIGDFRELDLSLPAADQALKLVCWINTVEKENFYPPFGADDLEENEIKASVPKFEYFLAAFGEVLAHPEIFQKDWEIEYNQVLTDYQVIHGADTQITTFPEIGLVQIQTPQPVHYYALFSRTQGYDMVLSQYTQNRYELEYKYTTWVDISSRPTLPRLPLKPLAQVLQNLETTNRTWTAESVTDTGPILRLNESDLPKKQRYANPTERPIYSSNILPEELSAQVISYFQARYAGVLPKQHWTWPEIKAFK